jgi:SAM-dependent methyltransferase
MAAPVETEGRAIEWEEPGCLLCGSRLWAPFVEASDHLAREGGRWFAVVRCRDCGLCYTSPRPSLDSIGQFYPPAYWPERAPSPREKKALGFRPPRLGRLARKERKALPWHGQGRLLDFGCGGGVFLERMSVQGWQVTGLDLAPAAVRRVRTELGLPALVGSLPHPELDPGSFDVITMWHSLEHVHDPRGVLREAFLLLAPGGKLIVAVPNLASLAFRWFGRFWYGLDLPRHLSHFTPQTLTWMLEGTGFRAGRVRMVRQTAWMRASARLACQHPDALPWHHWLQGKPGSRLACWYSCVTGRADCMLVEARRPA